MRKVTFLYLFIIIFCTKTFALNIQNKQIVINRNIIHYYQVYNPNNKLNLIMLTGIGTTANFWPKEFIEILAKKYNLYILDYRGINTQQNISNLNYSINDLAKDTNAFIDTLKLKDLYLLGWSMGGAIALQSAFDKPELFKHIFLISSAVPLNKQYHLPKKLSQTPVLNTKDDVYNYVFSNIIYNYSPKKINKNISQFINPDISKLFPNNLVYAQQKRYLVSWMSNKNNLQKFINIKVPVTFFLADNDEILNINDLQKSISMIKNKTIVNIIHFPASGHAIDWNYPYQLGFIIDDLA
ncbi:MAG: hypothetical protein Kow0076_3160 [Francisella sp.]